MNGLSESIFSELIGTNLAVKIIIGIFIGFLVGLVPYLIAKKRGHLKLGKIALAVCALSGSIFGLVSALPIAAIFTMVVALKEHEENGL